MDEQVMENNNLSINNSNIYDKSYDTINNTNNVAEECHENIIEKKKRKVTRRMKRKKIRNQYDSICGRYFLKPQSFANHMKNYHGYRKNRLGIWEPFQTCLKNNNLIFQMQDKPNDALPEVTSDTSCTAIDNNQLKCNISDSVMKSHDKLLEHENLHDQLCVNSSNDENQQSQEEEPLINIRDIPGTSRGEIDEVTCSQCLCKIRSIDILESHINNCRKRKKLCDILENFKKNNCPSESLIPDLVELFIEVNSEPIEEPSEPIDDNESVTSEPVEPSESIIDDDANMPVTKKIIGILDKNHLETLQRLTIVPRSFACDFCDTTCDRADHLEYQNWWTSVDMNEFQCYQCFERFSDVEIFQIHVLEHDIIDIS